MFLYRFIISYYLPTLFNFFFLVDNEISYLHNFRNFNYKYNYALTYFMNKANKLYSQIFL